jgi:RNA polymerase sigma-70 factor, ECF subfamily
MPPDRHLLDMAGIAQGARIGDTTIAQAAAGDAIAFARIVEAHHGDMTRVAYVVTGGDQDLAADAVQAAWVIAWRRLGSLRDPARLRPWLVSIAANEARQLCRRTRRRAVIEIDVAAVEDAVPATLGRDPADRAAILDLRRAVRRLSAEDRALLALRYVAGLDSPEIAALAGRAAPTIRWRLAGVLARLRKELADA